MTDFSSLQRQWLPALVAPAAPGTPAQQAFRQALAQVDALRERLLALRAAQVATRQAYWRQVGPLAAAAVAARRALYAPLEAALLGGYLHRAEQQQVTELLLHNARSLQIRFGEDETEILRRYAPPLPLPDDAAEERAGSPEPLPGPLPHEQAAAAARARRQQRTQRAQATQATEADTQAQALLQNTKAAYRQLARLHHPDRAAQADAATQQAQTALMQHITAAYAAGDLAALLALLADAEPPTPPAPEAEALLQRYTQALAQQQTRLHQELAAAERPEPDAPWSGTEKQQRTRLRQIKRDLREETEYLAHLARPLHEPTSLRQLLRELAARGQAGL